MNAVRFITISSVTISSVVLSIVVVDDVVLLVHLLYFVITSLCIVNNVLIIITIIAILIFSTAINACNTLLSIITCACVHWRRCAVNFFWDVRKFRVA